MQTNTHKALCKLLQGDYRTETSEQLVKRVDGLVQALRTERDSLNVELNGTKEHLNILSGSNDKLTKLAADLRTQRDALYARLTQVVDVTGEPTLEELVNVVLKRLDSAQRLEGLVITDMDGNTLDWELSEGVVEIESDVSKGYRDALIKALGFLDHHADMSGLIKRVEETRKDLSWAVATIRDIKSELGISKDSPDSSILERIKALVKQRDDLYTQVQEQGGATRHTPRYIVHGDIQPCVVLYSDETTTLVRLDENDMMCETSTIEWSDELTYRCQEMLRQTAPVNAHLMSYAKALAELVANEELLINDVGSYQWKSATDDRPRCVTPDVRYVAPKHCMTCLHVFDGTLDLCPQCQSSFGGETDA